MTYAFASADVPKINVIVGEAYGSAYVAMNSKHIGADLCLALDTAKVGVMDARAAARIMYEDEISSAADTKTALDEKADEFDQMQKGADAAARRGYVDNVIAGESIRKHLIYALQMFEMR
jgi:acetyl-CoA carboxylase carboxyltransferase component